jgi:hypothetical protein
LPKEALERILFKGRAEVRIADDHIELWPLTTAINGEESNDILNAQNGNGLA